MMQVSLLPVSVSGISAASAAGENLARKEL